MHRVAVLRRPDDRAVPERGARLGEPFGDAVFTFGVAEAKSRNVWRRSSTGANAAALSSDAEPGVTLTISSAASANS